MRTESTFRAAYQALELRVGALAEADGDIFLPNPAPGQPVHYVLICMEPSLGLWAQTPADAKAKVASGFRNFLYSLEDFILHFCARRYLCDAGEQYHITDLSKGAMLVDHAGSDRVERYNRWHVLLEEELDLISRPGAGVIAVGKVVSEHLKRRNFGKDFTPVIHYSGQAAAARKAGVVGREREFEEFKKSVSLDDVLSNAEKVLVGAGMPSEARAETLRRLANARLSESRRQLIFNYKTAFGSIRCSRE